MSDEDLSHLAAVISDLEEAEDQATMGDLRGLRDEVTGMVARVDVNAEEVSRRRGALAAAVGRTESRVRALKETA